MTTEGLVHADPITSVHPPRTEGSHALAACQPHGGGAYSLQPKRAFNINLIARSATSSLPQARRSRCAIRAASSLAVPMSNSRL